MKPITFRKSLVILVCGAGVSAWGALKPEGDKIEFSPPREVLKVAPVTGSDLRGPAFNFQRRDPGGSVSDVPTAVALPAPDQVNRMRALQDLIEQRNSWARPEEFDSNGETDLNDRYLTPETELSIDDLFDRRNGKSGGIYSRQGEGESSRYGGSRDREDRWDGSSGDRRGLNNRDANDRGRNQDRDRDPRSRTDGDDKRDPLIDGPSPVGELGGDRLDSGRNQRDGVGSNADPDERDRRGASEGLFEYGTSGPKIGDFMRASTREGSDGADRLDSLRRVLGGSADSILGTSAGTRSGFGAGATPGGMFGTLGGTPGVNRGFMQTLDSRAGAGAVVPTAEAPGTGERLTSLPNRPLGLDLTTGREGFSSRSERMQLTAPTPTPMELFRRKHDPRMPSRDF